VPIYEYRCEKCGHRTEIIQKFSDPPLTECARCKGQLSKVIAPPALQFKGSGWYITDYSDKGKPPKSETETKTDSKENKEKKPASESTDKTSPEPKQSSTKK
jgi:putative FmdB family regulatory protein